MVPNPNFQFQLNQIVRLLYARSQAREKNTRLIVAGNDSPPQLPCQIADLRNRLSWGLVFQVKNLTDEQKLLALQMRAKNRGLQISREVGLFLLNHYPRNMTVLFNCLEELDRASLIAKRRITIPFVKEVLEDPGSFIFS